MIVRARSPYIIFINEVGQTSGKLELRIWKKGEAKPTLPTYSFTKSIPSPTQTLLRFNISPYLKDFISNELIKVDTWYCNFECRLFSNNVELTAKKVEGIAVNGYTTFLQGQNATGTAHDLTLVNNLQIGGRNHYKKNSPITPHAGLTCQRDGINFPEGIFVVGTNDYAGWFRIHNVINSNGWWTISWDMRGSQSVAVGVDVDICDLGIQRFNTTTDNTWKRFSLSVNVTKRFLNWSKSSFFFCLINSLGMKM